MVGQITGLQCVQVLGGEEARNDDPSSYRSPNVEAGRRGLHLEGPQERALSKQEIAAIAAAELAQAAAAAAAEVGDLA